MGALITVLILVGKLIVVNERLAAGYLRLFNRLHRYQKALKYRHLGNGCCYGSLTSAGEVCAGSGCWQDPV